MSETSTLIGYKGRTIPREELLLSPHHPQPTRTDQCHTTRSSRLLLRRWGSGISASSTTSTQYHQTE